MQLSDFDFQLPQELIAHEPAAERDQSKLLIAHDNKFTIKDFRSIIDYLNPGDVLVLNDSKVIKSKLIVKRNGVNIELHLIRQLNKNTWNAFAKPAKKLKEGEEFNFNNHKMKIARKLQEGEIHLEFALDNIEMSEFLEQHGKIPIPPYIKNQNEELHKERYQTVYAQKDGSVAAPTAGLHFTKELLDTIETKDIKLAYVTLHVGPGTFLPVKDFKKHVMHRENGIVSKESAEVINQAKREGRRVIAVGTTAMRVVESLAYKIEVMKTHKEAISRSKPFSSYQRTVSKPTSIYQVEKGQVDTNLFITPGYQFKIFDMLITNFHLPKSTLFMLVCAFSGLQEMHQTYKYAIENKVRFYSYGDASLLYRKIK